MSVNLIYVQQPAGEIVVKYEVNYCKCHIFLFIESGFYRGQKILSFLIIARDSYFDSIVSHWYRRLPGKSTS